METEKSFAAKFSQRSQRTDETVEEFAADLIRLYAKHTRTETVEQSKKIWNVDFWMV